MAAHTFRVTIPDDSDDRLALGEDLLESLVAVFGDGVTVESHDPWTGGQGAPDQWDRIGSVEPDEPDNNDILDDWRLR